MCKSISFSAVTQPFKHSITKRFFCLVRQAFLKFCHQGQQPLDLWTFSPINSSQSFYIFLTKAKFLRFNSEIVSRRCLLFAVFSTSSAFLCLLFTECTQESLKSDFNKNCGCLTLPTATSDKSLNIWQVKHQHWYCLWWSLKIGKE